jgi:protein TonB
MPTTRTMPTSALRLPTVGRRFGTVLVVSCGLHLVTLVGYAWWDARKAMVIELPDQPIKASLVRLGKPRDQKLLPRLDTAPAPKPKDKSVAIPTKDTKPAPAAAPVEDGDRLKKAMERIESMREDAERDRAKEDALARIAQRVGKADPEQEGQPDGDPRGESATPGQINAYLGSLHAAVKQQYVVPSVISQGECLRLVATVMVRISLTGEVLETKVHKGSGNDFFDAAVVSAVKGASPLPAPPPNMRQMVTDGFGFKFRCER